MPFSLDSRLSFAARTRYKLDYDNCNNHKNVVRAGNRITYIMKGPG